MPLSFDWVSLQTPAAAAAGHQQRAILDPWIRTSCLFYMTQLDFKFILGSSTVSNIIRGKEPDCSQVGGLFNRSRSRSRSNLIWEAID
jgi:hypothetical protein